MSLRASSDSDGEAARIAHAAAARQRDLEGDASPSRRASRRHHPAAAPQRDSMASAAAGRSAHAGAADAAHGADDVSNPDAADGKAGKPAIPPKEMTASDVFCAIGTVVFFPIWLVVALFVWLAKSSESSQSAKTPLEMQEALELVKATQQPRAKDEAAKVDQVRTHMFAVLSAVSAMENPLPVEEAPSFGHVLFPWVASWAPQTVAPKHDAAEMQKTVVMLWEAFPTSTQAYLARADQRSGDEQAAAIKAYKERVIDHLFDEGAATLPEFVAACSDLYGRANPDASPLMARVLALHQAPAAARDAAELLQLTEMHRQLTAEAGRIEDASGDSRGLRRQIAEIEARLTAITTSHGGRQPAADAYVRAFTELLMADPAPARRDGARGRSDVSNEHVTAVLKRHFVAMDDADRAIVRAMMQAGADQVGARAADAAALDKEMAERRKERPFFFERLAALGIPFEPKVKAADK